MSHYQQSRESAMLDDIEASSGRIYDQTRILKTEADLHNSALSGITTSMDENTKMLHEEANYVARVRKAANTGVCWMYGVIAAESLMLLFLLYIQI